MKRTTAAAVLTAALCGVASAASAAVIPVTFSAVGSDGSFSGTFGDTGITNPTFTDTFTFTLPTGLASSTVSSTFQGLTTDVNFTSVTLDGHQFNIGDAGKNEFRFLDNLPVTAGPQTLTVSGTSGGNGSFAGTIAFAPSRAVPEPASWALMILGFGGVGASLRRRHAKAALGLA
jgi:opacity protein-like surface antigen